MSGCSGWALLRSVWQSQLKDSHNAPSVVLYFCSDRISTTSENGRGTLTIRDVKDMDQGAYTCEAINAKGLVFGIPDGVLTLTSESNPGADISPLHLFIHLSPK